MIHALEQKEAHGKAGRISLSQQRMDLAIRMNSVICHAAKPAARCRFHFLSTLYKHISVVVITHLNFAERAKVPGDATVTTDVLVWLTHYCHTVETNTAV